MNKQNKLKQQQHQQQKEKKLDEKLKIMEISICSLHKGLDNLMYYLCWMNEQICQLCKHLISWKI